MEKNKLHSFRNFIIPRRISYDIEDIEKSLKDLNDILFAKIVLSEDEDIKEIHIITNDSSNPKNITRDIESFLLAKYNIQVDYRKISIAQVKDKETGDGKTKEEEELESSLRLKFSDIKVGAIGNQFEVCVKLESNGKIYEGKVSGKNWDKNREYLVAKAALEGMSSYLEGSIFFQVDEIKKIELDSKEIVVVSINLIDSKGKENLVGSTVIKDDFNKAIVKAILKATNRRIITKAN
ncbi:MAG: hypothetical protein E4G71_03540 [Candidatus Atribacteria bacterium]|nr:MAG: hypothetical protein E4G71_03540 [Candidatus Atribacteria bacterium]